MDYLDVLLLPSSSALSKVILHGYLLVVDECPMHLNLPWEWYGIVVGLKESF